VVVQGTYESVIMHLTKQNPTLLSNVNKLPCVESGLNMLVRCSMHGW
jgi:hypothetical protein